MTDTYHLPENAEGAIIGCLLLYPDTKAAVSKLVTAEDFSSPAFAAMFNAALELDEPDSVKFAELVRQQGVTLPDGFFQGLCDIAVNRGNAELYAKLLRDEAMRRRLSELAQQVQGAVAERQPSAEIITAASDRLGEIERGTISGDLASPKAAARAFWEHRKLVESGDGAVSTGYAPLDRILGGGMLRSGLYILAARPGMGKTTFALQIADHIAQQGRVLFVSLEMSLEQLQGKRLARETGIPSNKILLSDGRELDYGKIKTAERTLLALPVSVSTRPSVTVAQVRQMAKRLDGLRAVVVDYLGKLSPTDRRASRYEAITAISGDLKALAVELGVPVLALAQLNRENMARTDKRPQLSDLRDSGAVEQDADGVVMLHRSDYYEMSDTPLESWQCVELEIIIRKNRHGGIGACKAAFFPATGRIMEA